MSTRQLDNNGAPAESVSPSVFIPAITVTGILVLIVVGGAVFMILRAYKRRRERRGQRLSKLDVESSDGTWRGGDWDAHVRNGRLTRDSRQPKGFAARTDDTITRPETAALAGEPPVSWNAQDIVGQGDQREGSPTRETITKRVVNIWRGYEFGSVKDDIIRGVHTEKTTPAPSMTHSYRSEKIDRITGSQISNHLYEDHASAKSLYDSKELAAENEKAFSGLDMDPELASSLLTINTGDFSPVTSMDSREFEFTPSSPSIGTALKPPPLTSTSTTYRPPQFPNIAALTQGYFRTFSFQEQVPSLTEHIASQFNPVKRERTRRDPTATKLAPPFSAAFGEFTGLALREPQASSASAFGHGTVDLENSPPAPPPKDERKRTSWNGRSILLLDDARPHPQSYYARPVPTTLNLDADSDSDPADHFPNVITRTSAVGNFVFPLPPQSYPEEFMDTELVLTLTASKASVSSLHSSVSSFSTTYAGGLSPAPAPRPYFSGSSDGSSSVNLARSAMTAAELEMELRRIRDKASSERRMRERRMEEYGDEEFEPARASFGFI